MAKLDLVQVTGYSVVYHVREISAIVAQPILGIYVERHAYAVEVLTECGEVIELSPTCVLELPDGKLSVFDMVFDDEETWLKWVIELGRDDVCTECREKERAELEGV